MNNYNLLLNSINFFKNKMKIDLAAVYPSDGFVPKIDAVFTQGENIRRLPVLLKSTHNRSGDGMKISIFSYTFLMDSVFLGEVKPEDIEMTFEIRSGNENYSRIPFCVSDDIVGKTKNRVIPREYIAGDVFEGVCVYSRQEDTEPDEETEEDYSYSFEPCPEEEKVIIRIKELKGTNSHRILSGIFLKFTFILALFGIILLLPYFVIDAFLAALGVIPGHTVPETNNFIILFLSQFKANIATFLKYDVKDKKTALRLISIRDTYYEHYYRKLCRKPVVQNRVSFISGRRDELGGNEKYVYDLIKDNKDIEFRFLMNSELDRYSKSGKKEFYELYATSKIVIVDDFYNLLNTVDKRDDVTLFQFWHACGAFKTFGFTRLGKPGGPKQKFMSHRMYDYATVSSADIVKYYSEGFGISDRNVIPTGIPRTDIFFDSEYRDRVRNDFYSKYPHLRDKKIIMFAPTFRGWGQLSAFYPVSVFDPCALIDSIGDEYAVIIKLHPFAKDRFEIDEKYRDSVIDLSEEDELNDLLFITDILITDYSSCIFEASLLDIPMLFYAFDLYQYVSERDFYCDFETFVPGKIVFNQNQLSDAITEGDFESGKIPDFRQKFMSGADGKSSERVAGYIMNILNDKEN